MNRPAAVRWLLRRELIPYFVLVAGLLATALGMLYVESSARRKDEIRFEGAVQQVHSRISTSVDTYVALLRASAGLFAASREVSPTEFRDFVARLDLRGHYPGIQGIGFARQVLDRELAAVVEEMRRAGMDGFSVTPADPRRVYYPIVYLEPLDRRNRAAIGYDMFTEPVRHAAMRRAAAIGGASASGKVELKQEIEPEKQSGFLIYVPVYRHRARLETEAQRVAALQGFVYSPFRAGDFLHAVLDADRGSELHITVYDGSATDPASLLFDSGAHAGVGERASRYQRHLSVEVYGRPWLLVARTGAGFEERSEYRLLRWILAAGVFITLILWWLTRSEVAARRSAERAAFDLSRSEEALRGSEAQLRRLVEAERHAHAEAAAANRAKDEFLATLSHELRTPLNAILGWATMLERDQLAAEQKARAVEVIARNARTQAQLIEDLLDVSRIITGKLRINMRPTNLSSAVRAAIDAVRPTAEVKQVTVEQEFLTDGPVLGDTDRLQQIIWNLLSNAIKFTPAGGRVAIRLAQQDGTVALTVQDSGIGIDASFLPHVFERFRQRDSSTTRSHGGMGLGLAIVRHLVELHGGSIRASSDGEGRGAAFTLELPVRATRAGGAGEPVDAIPSDDGRTLTGVRVLVVDDEHDSREMLKNALVSAGSVVTTAHSADAALEVLDHQPVDVLLADISMPGTDGYELLTEVRAHRNDSVRSLPAVAVTANARDEDRRRAEAAGFHVHVAKPVDIAALLDAVRRLARSTAV